MAGKNNLRVPIISALIGAAGVIVAAIITSTLSPSLFQKLIAPCRQLVVRVADEHNVTISGAKVMLFFDGGQLIKYTDSNGITSIGVDTAETASARLFVETSQYGVYDQEITPSRDKVVDVRLRSRSQALDAYYARLVDTQAGSSVAPVDIQLSVAGRTYTQKSDAYGIVKFTIPDNPDGVAGRIIVTKNGKEYIYDNVALSNTRLSDIDISQNMDSKNTDTITAPKDGDTRSIEYGQTLPGSIDKPAELDKYRFTANKGDTVVINEVRSSGSFWPEIRLYDPSGSLIKETSGATIAKLEQALSDTGTYVILVGNALGGAETGEYYISIHKTK